MFSYGSNGVEQLRDRVGNPSLSAVKALLPNAQRVFGGWSSRWDGAVATVVPRAGYTVQGSIALLTSAELRLLDGFERTVPDDPYAVGGAYRRHDVTVMVGDDGLTLQAAVIYILNDAKWEGLPSLTYLEACYKNVAAFWAPAVIDVCDVSGKMMQDPYTGDVSS